MIVVVLVVILNHIYVFTMYNDIPVYKVCGTSYVRSICILFQRKQLLDLGVLQIFIRLAFEDERSTTIKYPYSELTKLYSLVSILIRSCDVSKSMKSSIDVSVKFLFAAFEYKVFCNFLYVFVQFILKIFCVMNSFNHNCHDRKHPIFHRFNIH